MRNVIKKTIKNNRGVALIITILIISLIVPLTLQFMDATLFDRISAANLGDGIKAECSARSGFQYALAVLYQDASSDRLSSGCDSLNEPWAKSINPDPDGTFVDDYFKGEDLDRIVFDVKIIDHSGKINVNRLISSTSLDPNENSNPSDPAHTEGFYSAQQKILKRLLTSLENLKLEEDEVGDIVDSIIDWIDEDDEMRGLGGAENSYYQGLSRPYPCKNAPMETLEELILVKGMTHEIYNGIKYFLTVYGDGMININTANEKVLKSLHEDMDSDLAAEMIEYREEEKNIDDLCDSTWYTRIPGMGGIAIGAHITVSSAHFEIISTGSTGALDTKETDSGQGIKKVVRGMVERGDTDLKILSWKIE